jgi:hypothetical protein
VYSCKKNKILGGRCGLQWFNEVEIFSNAYWKENQDIFLEKIIKAYKAHS